MANTRQLGVLLTAVIVTGLIVAIDLADGWHGWEARSVDLRYTLPTRTPEPMDTSIVHVDIDDSALEHIGRWPWDRSVLADAVDTLTRAGARTIALDLLLSDPQMYPAGSTMSIDHDGRLADALSATRAVLPVLATSRTTLDMLGLRPGDADDLVWLFEIMADPRYEYAALVDIAWSVGLNSPRWTTLLQRRSLELRKAAAWHLANAPLATNLIATNDAIVARAWQRRLAWNALHGLRRSSDTTGVYRDEPPHPRFAACAAATGNVGVNDQRDDDGAIRSLSILTPTPAGDALPFGVAAALAHLEIPVGQVQVSATQLAGAGFSIPLRDGDLDLHWPTSQSSPRWLGLLRQSPDDDRAAGHLSIREIVELARARRTLITQREQLRQVSALILAFAAAEFAEGTEASDEAQLFVADEVDFALSETDEPGETGETDEPDDEDSAAYLDHLHNCRLWRQLGSAIHDTDTRIARSAQELQDAVEDRLIFIGWTASGAAADFVPTAMGARTPGVVVHAAIANMILTNGSATRLPGWTQTGLVIVFGFLCAFAASRTSTVRSTGFALTLLIGYAAIGGIWLFTAHTVILPMVAPLLAGGSSWIAGTTLQAALSKRDRRRITRQFRARVAPQLVDHLIDRPGAISVAGTRRESTVFFADLAGFTALSETLGPEQTVTTLNRYLSALTEVLVGHDAYVNKFLGDGIMAFWSAFEPDERQADHAVAAARACQRSMDELNRQTSERPLSLRIGIATGAVIVGDCGAPPALNDYTVIGDTVNLAARLESANKQFGTAVLLDGRTCEQLSEPAACIAVGRVIVVGQSRPTEIFELPAPESNSERAAALDRLVTAFRAGDLAAAGRALEALEEGNFASAIARIYRDSIAKQTTDGILRLAEK